MMCMINCFEITRTSSSPKQSFQMDTMFILLCNVTNFESTGPLIIFDWQCFSLLSVRLATILFLLFQFSFGN